MSWGDPDPNREAMDLEVLVTARHHNLRLTAVTDLRQAEVCHATADRLARSGRAVVVEPSKRSNRYGGRFDRFLCITAQGRQYIDAMTDPTTSPQERASIRSKTMTANATVTVNGFAIPATLPDTNRLKSLGLYILLAHAKHHNVAAGPETPKDQIIQRLEATRAGAGSKAPVAPVAPPAKSPSIPVAPPKTRPVVPAQSQPAQRDIAVVTERTADVAVRGTTPSTPAGDRWESRLDKLEAVIGRDLTALEAGVRSALNEALAPRDQKVKVLESRVAALEKRLGLLLEQVANLSPEGEVEVPGDASEEVEYVPPTIQQIVKGANDASARAQARRDEEAEAKSGSGYNAGIEEWRRLSRLCKEAGLPSHGKAEALRSRLVEAGLEPDGGPVTVVKVPVVEVAPSPAANPGHNHGLVEWRRYIKLCREYELPTTGKAAELKARLVEAGIID
jgi:hypothetical protein